MLNDFVEHLRQEAVDLWTMYFLRTFLAFFAVSCDLGTSEDYVSG